MKRWQIVSLISLVAIFVLIAGVFLWYWMDRQAGNLSVTKPTSGDIIDVIVAAQDIRAGERITREELTLKTIPGTELSDDFIRDYSDVVGSYARYNLPKGILITKAMLASP